MKRCLIIFAREPEKGAVKTRLSKDLSEEKCLNLYKAFLQDTIDISKAVHCEERVLAYQCENSNPKYLKKVGPCFRLWKQVGQDLGERMYRAFRFAGKNKAAKIVIIGSDTPNLPVHFVEQAFRRLEDNDVVIGPSLDGGYYLIGLKKPCLSMFEGIKWSADRVFTDTVKRAKRLKKKVSLLNRWYDLDDAETLAKLKFDLLRQKDKNVARWTKRFLKI